MFRPHSASQSCVDLPDTHFNRDRCRIAGISIPAVANDDRGLFRRKVGERWPRLPGVEGRLVGVTITVTFEFLSLSPGFFCSENLPLCIAAENVWLDAS